MTAAIPEAEPYIAQYGPAVVIPSATSIPLQGDALSRRYVNKWCIALLMYCSTDLVSASPKILQSPHDSRNRFHIMLTEILRIITTERMVTLFIDDIQVSLRTARRRFANLHVVGRYNNYRVAGIISGRM